jgi:hypothetical protein
MKEGARTREGRRPSLPIPTVNDYVSRTLESKHSRGIRAHKAVEFAFNRPHQGR